MHVDMSKLDIDWKFVCPRPWVGPDRFERPNPAALASTHRFVADSAEERFWRGLAPSVFAPAGRPGRLCRLLQHIAVVPLAHVTFLNLHYQIYLNQVMHTSAQAWLGHLLCIPLNVALLFYALCLHLGADAAGLLLLLLGAWYLGMASMQRSALWAGVSLVVLVGVWQLGSSAAAWVGALEGGLPWYLRPLVLMFAVSAVQACSHLFEHNIPPRANFEQHWSSLREFVWGAPHERTLASCVRGLLWSPIGLMWGTLDEWWASTKLMPIYMLELLWMLGHQPAQRRLYRERTLAALASGDPALDWVGVGGGASVATLDEACPSGVAISNPCGVAIDDAVMLRASAWA